MYEHLDYKHALIELITFSMKNLLLIMNHLHIDMTLFQLG